MRVLPGTWDFAATHANEIESHWAHRLTTNPGYFNGVVHVMADWHVNESTFVATFYRSDFKSFLYWREHGYPPAHALDAFGSAMVLSREGCVLLGHQSAGHINAGRAYLPSGFIDQRDCNNEGVIDIAASVMRELCEETGLTSAHLHRVPGFVIVVTGMIVCIAVRLQSTLSSVDLVHQIKATLAADPDPELVDVIFADPKTDLTALNVPVYSALAMQTAFAGAQ
jgi:8-oxo-dGTP pyrophosphatase MutT (NUDIX family)